MSKRTIKDVAFLDRFIKRWTCSARNHPEGWAWWKRKNRKDTRLKLKGELRNINTEFERENNG